MHAQSREALFLLLIHEHNISFSEGMGGMGRGHLIIPHLHDALQPSTLFPSTFHFFFLFPFFFFFPGGENPCLVFPFGASLRVRLSILRLRRPRELSDRAFRMGASPPPEERAAYLANFFPTPARGNANLRSHQKWWR